MKRTNVKKLVFRLAIMFACCGFGISIVGCGKDDNLSDSRCLTAIELGKIKYGEKKYSEAILLFNEGFSYGIGKFGEHTDCSITSLAYVAMIQSRIGETGSSIKNYQKLIDLQIEKSGDSAVDVADSRQRLAELYLSVGEFDSAEMLLDEVLKVRSPNLGESDQKTIRTMNFSGVVAMNQGALEKAQLVLDKALSHSMKYLGEGNALTISIQQNLGELLYRKANYLDSLKVLESAYNTYVRLGNHDERVGLAFKSKIAQNYYHLNKLDVAEKGFNEVYEKSIILNGDNHPYSFNAKLNSVLVKCKLKKNNEVEVLSSDLLNQAGEYYGESNPDFLVIKQKIEDYKKECN